jgi:hypothetical protein
VPTYILPFEEVNNDALVSRINSHKDLDAELDRLCGLGVDGGRSTAGVSAKGNRPQFTLVKPADQDIRTDSPNDAHQIGLTFEMTIISDWVLITSTRVIFEVKRRNNCVVLSVRSNAADLSSGCARRVLSR